jgi:hypothetical protein
LPSALPRPPGTRLMMEREIRIKILPDGKVEIDSSIFKDCKEVAEYLTRVLGKAESFKDRYREITLENGFSKNTPEPPFHYPLFKVKRPWKQDGNILSGM